VSGAAGYDRERRQINKIVRPRRLSSGLTIS